MKNYLVVSQEKVSSGEGNIYINHIKFITADLKQAEGMCDSCNLSLNEKFKTRVLLFINGLYSTDFPSQTFIHGEYWLSPNSLH